MKPQESRMYPDLASADGTMSQMLRRRVVRVHPHGLLHSGIGPVEPRPGKPNGSRHTIEGKLRPEVIVKTKVDTKCGAGNNGANVGFAGTFDTGSDDMRLTDANLTALGLPGDGSSISPNVGGVINYQKVPPPDDGKVPEDSLTTCGNLVLSKTDPSKLSMGVLGFGTRVEKCSFNVLGSDLLLNGAVAVYDPNNAPKVIDMSSSGVVAADFPFGGNTVLSAAGNEGFNPKLKLSADLTRFNGISLRPTLKATFTNGDGSKKRGECAVGHRRPDQPDRSEPHLLRRRR